MRRSEIDGLRGYAAVAVALYHAILDTDATLFVRIFAQPVYSIIGTYDLLTKTALIVFNGDAAVILFFVMSGSVLFNSLTSDIRPVWQSATSFTVRRIFRIYPALLGCLLCMWLTSDLIGHALPAFAYIRNGLLLSFEVIGPSWTLNVEMVAIPFFLLAVAIYRRAAIPGLVVLFVIVGLLATVSWPMALNSARPYWLCFALGMLVATEPVWRLAKTLPPWTAIAALLTTLIIRHLIDSYNVGSKITIISAAITVMMVYHANAGQLGNFLSNSVSRFFGRISYSFYLFNVLVLYTIAPWIKSLPWSAGRPLESGLLCGTIVVALTIPLAYFSARFSEEPAIKLGRLLTLGAMTKGRADSSKPLN